MSVSLVSSCYHFQHTVTAAAANTICLKSNNCSITIFISISMFIYNKSRDKLICFVQIVGSSIQTFCSCYTKHIMKSRSEAAVLLEVAQVLQGFGIWHACNKSEPGFGFFNPHNQNRRSKAYGRGCFVLPLLLKLQDDFCSLIQSCHVKDTLCCWEKDK